MYVCLLLATTNCHKKYTTYYQKNEQDYNNIQLKLTYKINKFVQHITILIISIHLATMAPPMVILLNPFGCWWLLWPIIQNDAKMQKMTETLAHGYLYKSTLINTQ